MNGSFHSVEVNPDVVLVFGGPVSNLQALRAMRAEADRLGLTAEQCLCTGDVVAYCGDPAATVAEIRDWGCHVVVGNCERQLAEGAGDCGCGFEEGTVCDRLSVGWYAHAMKEVDAGARAWMAGLPDEIRFGENVAIHGGYSDMSRFVWPVSDKAVFIEELTRRSVLSDGPRPKRVFAGHCGLPFEKDVDGVHWVNAGTIGMPRNDGTRSGAYAVLRDDELRLHRLDYDWRAAQARMRAVGLTQGYDRCLETGVWPSQDILPESLRRTG